MADIEVMLTIEPPPADRRCSTHRLAMDFKPHESPMQHELVTDPWVPENGLIEVRNVPGLGVTVDETVVRKYTVV